MSILRNECKTFRLVQLTDITILSCSVLFQKISIKKLFHKNNNIFWAVAMVIGNNYVKKLSIMWKCWKATKSDQKIAKVERDMDLCCGTQKLLICLNTTYMYNVIMWYYIVFI